jgi:3-oxoacyl-[acyl-carrier protein] reductase
MAISNGLRPGLGMVAKALSDELGPRGIRVTDSCPHGFPPRAPSS